MGAREGAHWCVVISLCVTLLSGCFSREPNGNMSSSFGNFRAEAQTGRFGTTLTAYMDGKITGSLCLDNMNIKQILATGLRNETFVLVLTNNSRGSLRIYDSRLSEVWRGISPSLRPWKLTAGDVDGDGITDIGIGVYKRARFHPVMANRPFVYSWDGRELRAKWLGSRLSRPFTDFVIADFGLPCAKLIAIEQLRDGSNELAVYKWHGFGFIREWTGARTSRLTDLQIAGQPGNQHIVVREGRSIVKYTWNGRKLQRIGGKHK
ncbi:MAG: FG-GAP repeat domain-containing protein [Armatimonadota bacterium]